MTTSGTSQIAVAWTVKRCFCFLFVAGIIGLSSSVQADAGLIVITGSANEHVRAMAGTAAESAARDAGWSLTTRRLSRKETETLARCGESTSPECIPASLTDNGVAHVFLMTVDGVVSATEPSDVVLLAKLIVPGSRSLIVDRRYCEHCTEARLAQASEALAQHILRQLAAHSGRTLLEIATEPSGAQVVLDGQRIGVTNASFNTFPGKHIVFLEKAGYITEILDVLVEEGKVGRITVKLRASPVETRVLHARGSRRLPVALLSTGAAAVAGAVVLLAVDEDPSPSGGRLYWDTTPAGIVTGAAGFVVLGVGAYLWRRASRKPAGPTASAVPGGAFVGWRGSF